MDMTYHIWSQLPIELIILIIQSEQNLVSQCNWCWATRGSSVLHAAALAHRWCKTGLRWRDLQLDPSEYEDEISALVEPDSGKAVQGMDDFGAKLCAWNVDKHFRYNRISPVSLINRLIRLDHGLMPAQYVRSLDLDLGLDTAPSEFAGPSRQSMIYSLGLLFPHLRSLESLTLRWAIYDETLDAIGLMNPSSLRQLVLDVGKPRIAWTRRRPSNQWLDLGDGLTWTKLAPFKYLQSLTMMQLSAGETEQIEQLISTLEHLKELKLRACRPGFHDVDDSGKASKGPFQKLMRFFGRAHDKSNQGVKASLLMRFPASLRKLDLQDPFYLGPDSPQILEAPTDSVPVRAPKLEELATEFDDLFSTSNILSWLPNSRLKRLTFSPVPKDISADPVATPQALRVLNSLVTAHQNSLHELVLTNAWLLTPSLATEFNSHWSSRFRITDLVLGTDCPASDACDIKHIELHSKPLWHLIWGCGRDKNKWGSDLLRVRVESPWALHDIDFDAEGPLAEQGLGSLRILIISPRPACLKDGDLVEKHKEIAEKLVELAPETLRYISICGHDYWVDDGVGTEKADSKGVRQIVPWKSAIGGLDERVFQQVREWIRKEDTEFIEPKSWLNARRAGMNGVIGQYLLDQEWLQPHNFLVARKVEYSNI